MVILLMGVAGSGKTTVGRALAAELGWVFRDADDFHPPANIEKMSRALPLNDRDRAPWLAAIRAHIDEKLAHGENVVLTCSALKEKYRAVVMPDPARVKLVHLAGDPALIVERMRARLGHFMRPALLASQFADLEPPRAALTLDIAQPPAALVAQIRRAFSV
jgi:gluconokinase